MVLVGGLGTRLRPLTYVVPKPMLPIAGKPLLEHTVNYLKEHDITDVVLCVAYLKRQIMDYFKDGSSLGVKIRYAEADVPLGTAGQLRTAVEMIHDTFLAMNGDIVTSLNLTGLMEFHARNKGIGSIALKKYEVKIPYGYVEISQPESVVMRFQEKPSLSYLANAGIYVFERRVFDFIPPNKVVSLETEVFPKLISSGERLHGYYEDAFWADIGDLQDYEKADSDVLKTTLGKVQ